MKKALLLVAHGSRRAESNDEVRKLTDRLRDKAGNKFASVSCAFLELAEPSIPDGIQSCIDRGAEDVVVLPYFLSAGWHVQKDIPGQVAIKQREHSGVRIVIAPYLGAAEGIRDLLLGLVT